MQVNDSTFSINRKHLKAVLRASAKDDIRFNLNTVKVDVDKEGTTLSATNGHFLICIRHEVENSYEGSFLMPTAIAKRLTTGRLAVRNKADINVKSIGENQYMAEDLSLMDAEIKFKSTEWIEKYPCFLKVIPKGVSLKSGHYNPNYFYEVNKAAAEAFGKQPMDYNIVLLQNGESEAGVCIANASPNFFAVLLPINIHAVEANRSGFHEGAWSVPNWVKGKDK